MAEQVIRQTRVGSAPGVLWRALVAGLGYTLAAMIGGMVVQLLGLPLPEMASRVDPTQALVTTFLGGLIIGLTLGPLAARLTLPASQRAGLLFFVLFILNSLVNAIEALFFTTIPAAEQVSGLLSAAVGHAGLAILLALLFPPVFMERGLLTALRETLRKRRWISWAWRFGLAGFLYLPTYFLFGLVIYPIVRPYYEDPSLGLNLVVPGPEIVLPLEIGRGLLIVVALFPLIAVLGRPRWSLAFWLGVTLVILGSVAPMLQATWWPLTMRAVHGLEIAADSVLHGLLIAWLLGFDRGKEGLRPADHVAFQPDVA